MDLAHRIPKAELHLHLEGTVTPATMSELSRRHSTPLEVTGSRYAPSPTSGDFLDEAAVERLYHYEDFTGFLMAFKAVTERMRTPEDYELVTYRMIEQLAAQNVLHAEVYVSVGVVHWRGHEFAPLFVGMERGRIAGARDFGVSVLWIFDAVRHFGAEECARVADLAAVMRTEQIQKEGASSIVGIGIGGDERRAAASLFTDVYRNAAKNDLRLTAHAGETMGPESVWGAINILSADHSGGRIGHGLSILQDEELVHVLAERQIPVEICMTSNVRTWSLDRIELHPVKQIFDAGVMVTLNTDDPTMFGTTLTREYRLAKEIFAFTDDQLHELARNSFEASFLPAEKKLEFLKRVDAV